MELVLNLVWLAVVLTAAAKFALWRRGHSVSRQRLVAICALCVLALLFPIVSATDDLHMDTAGAEETSALRRAPLVSVAQVTTVLVALAAIEAIVTVAAAARAMVLAIDDHPHAMRDGFAAITSFRGPPSVQLPR